MSARELPAAGSGERLAVRCSCAREPRLSAAVMSATSSRRRRCRPASRSPLRKCRVAVRGGGRRVQACHRRGSLGGLPSSFRLKSTRPAAAVPDDGPRPRGPRPAGGGTSTTTKARRAPGSRRNAQLCISCWRCRCTLASRLTVFVLTPPPVNAWRYYLPVEGLLELRGFRLHGTRPPHPAAAPSADAPRATGRRDLGVGVVGPVGRQAGERHVRRRRAAASAAADIQFPSSPETMRPRFGGR